MRIENDNPYQVRMTIRNTFADNYHDLKIYRWMNRNKEWLKWFFAGWGLVSALYMGYGRLGSFLTWFFSLFSLIVLGAIDHQYIGFRLKKIIRILKKDYQITVTKKELLDACRDLIPQ